MSILRSPLANDLSASPAIYFYCMCACWVAALSAPPRLAISREPCRCEAESANSAYSGGILHDCPAALHGALHRVSILPLV